MSSRRLLALIDVLSADDDSALARECRDQDWSLKQYLDAANVNELRRLRADQAAIHANHKLDIDMVESPSQRRDSDALLDRTKDVRSHIMDQLMGKNKTE